MAINTGSKWRVKGAKNLRDAYAIYCEDNPAPLPYSEYRKLIEVCNDVFFEMLIEKGKRMRMPNLFDLQILKAKSNFDRMDMNHYMQTGNKIAYDDSASDGFRARCRWFKKGVQLKEKAFYKFTLVKARKKQIVAQMRLAGGHKIYSENYG